MHRVAKFEFTGKKLIGAGREFAELELDRCLFNGCALAQHDDPELGLVVRDVTATRCRTMRSVVHGVRFEDVRIDGLAASSIHHLAACVFRHVTLTGRIGGLMVVGPNAGLAAAVQAAFDKGIAAYYEFADWALDISRAEFVDADFSYVPGHLIRRDEETQFLLHRDRVAAYDVATLPTYANIAARRFEGTPFETLVAIAPKRAKHFERRLAELRVLRTEGLAD